ncbi:hypothetical protein FKM82_012117 [Ascaphus truei]
MSILPFRYPWLDLWWQKPGEIPSYLQPLYSPFPPPPFTRDPPTPLSLSLPPHHPPSPHPSPSPTPSPPSPPGFFPPSLLPFSTPPPPDTPLLAKIGPPSPSPPSPLNTLAHPITFYLAPFPGAPLNNSHDPTHLRGIHASTYVAPNAAPLQGSSIVDLPPTDFELWRTGIPPLTCERPSD